MVNLLSLQTMPALPVPVFLMLGDDAYQIPFQSIPAKLAEK